LSPVSGENLFPGPHGTNRILELALLFKNLVRRGQKVNEESRRIRPAFAPCGASMRRIPRICSGSALRFESLRFLVYDEFWARRDSPSVRSHPGCSLQAGVFAFRRHPWRLFLPLVGGKNPSNPCIIWRY
jgi:hypothetical protein